jgi:hypothetical protein
VSGSPGGGRAISESRLAHVIRSSAEQSSRERFGAQEPGIISHHQCFPGEDRIFNALPMFHSFAMEMPDVQKLTVPGTGKINYVSLKENAGRATVAASGAWLAEINATSVAP